MSENHLPCRSLPEPPLPRGTALILHTIIALMLAWLPVVLIWKILLPLFSECGEVILLPLGAAMVFVPLLVGIIRWCCGRIPHPVWFAIPLLSISFLIVETTFGPTLARQLPSVCRVGYQQQFMVGGPSQYPGDATPAGLYLCASGTGNEQAYTLSSAYINYSGLKPLEFFDMDVGLLMRHFRHGPNPSQPPEPVTQAQMTAWLMPLSMDASSRDRLAEELHACLKSLQNPEELAQSTPIHWNGDDASNAQAGPHLYFWVDRTLAFPWYLILAYLFTLCPVLGLAWKYTGKRCREKPGVTPDEQTRIE